MTGPNWRDPKDYPTLDSHEAPAFAWEFLRRDPEFRADQARLEQAARIGALTPEDARRFAERWGVRFRNDFEEVVAGETDVIWTPEALPSVVRLTTMPDLAIAALRSPMVIMEAPVGRGDFSFRYRDETFRFHVTQNGGPPMTALLLFDDLIGLRATAAARLRLAMAGKSVGKNPAFLTRERQARLVLALRALDAKVEGVTNREIAAGLFPNVHIAPEAWISHDLRDRTARLVRLGERLMRGGYRQLLLYPHRARTSAQAR